MSKNNSLKVDSSDKKIALQNALASIQKQFGSGSIMQMDGSYRADVEVCSTGSLTLDMALGVNGLPYGRIVEIFGPESSGKTTMTLQTIAQAQKNNKTCVFIDAEHAFDPIYAKNLGVNLDELYVSQPSSGEEALEITEKMISSGAVDLIVIDSVAGLVPRAELEGEMGDSHVGLQARLMSQALRKLTGIAKKQNTLVIFINQIRMKIGVMFGCLHADTEIPFADGRVFTIKDVVDNQITGKVYSLNEETGLLEEKEIVDWHYNGDVDSASDYLEITTEILENKTKEVQGKLTATRTTQNHKVYVLQRGWIEAKDLNIDDVLISLDERSKKNQLVEIVKGILLADANANINKQFNEEMESNKNNNFDNYLISKIHALSVLDIESIKKEMYKKSGKLKPKKINIGNTALATWFIESGFIESDDSVLFKNATKKHSKVLDSFGIDSEIKCFKDENTSEIIKCLWVKKQKSLNKLYSILKSELDKGLVEYFGLRCFFSDREWDLLAKNKFNENETVLAKILNIQELSDIQMNGEFGKYDITVEDNHNYLAGSNGNGVIVHNSPETTTGGNALKFYASVRLDIRRTGQIKKGEDIIGNETKVKVIKNKVAPPFKEAVFDILYGQGVNQTAEILDLAVKFGLVQKSGAWYSYNGGKIGQGKDNSIVWLNENEDVKNTLHSQIINLNKNSDILDMNKEDIEYEKSQNPNGED